MLSEKNENKMKELIDKTLRKQDPEQEPEPDKDLEQRKGMVKKYPVPEESCKEGQKDPLKLITDKPRIVTNEIGFKMLKEMLDLAMKHPDKGGYKILDKINIINNGLMGLKANAFPNENEITEMVKFTFFDLQD